jgi:thioredoxin-related protein
LLEDLAGFTDRARVLVVRADPTATALANDSLGLEVLVPSEEFLDRLEVSVLPTVVLLDRSGRLVERFEGYSTKVAVRISAVLDEATEVNEP